MSIPEKKLPLTPEDMKLIMDNSYDEIFVTDKDCRIIYVNGACKRNYGPMPEEIIGKTVYEMVDSNYYSPPLAPIVIQQKKTVTMEQITKFGVKLLVTATPVFDDNGEIRIVVMNSRDITELEKLKYDVEETKKLLSRYKEELKSVHRDELALAGIVTGSQDVISCYTMAKKVAKTDATILLLGESGVGKNILANYIHAVSERRGGPFVQVNCASIPDNLLESELFGYCRGAFSGAEKTGKRGLAELANHGTLFLDEIGELSLSLQAKLLQLIQEKSFLPIGGNKMKYVDIRIIAATNRDMSVLVKERCFREDLYYRLNVIEITLPPLRERKGDIKHLVNYLISKINAKYKTFGVIDPEVLPILEQYSWPGNIRELEHVLERLILTVDNDIVSVKHLPNSIVKTVSFEKEFYVDQDTSFPDSCENFVANSTTSFKEMEIQQILSLYQKLHSSYKVSEEMHISQSKATRIINKYLKSKSEVVDTKPERF